MIRIKQDELWDVLKVMPEAMKSQIGPHQLFISKQKGPKYACAQINFIRSQV